MQRKYKRDPNIKPPNMKHPNMKQVFVTLILTLAAYAHHRCAYAANMARTTTMAPQYLKCKNKMGPIFEEQRNNFRTIVPPFNKIRTSADVIRTRIFDGSLLWSPVISSARKRGQSGTIKRSPLPPRNFQRKSSSPALAES